MSSLQYANEEGAGTTHSGLFHYSQAVILPHGIVKCSGQGGWTNAGELDANDHQGQVDLAFDNVDRVLQAAGLRGWEDVYCVRSYHIDIDAGFAAVSEKMKKRIPEHKPIWSAVGVTRLALPTMLIEIEVEAFKQA